MQAQRPPGKSEPQFYDESTLVVPVRVSKPGRWVGIFVFSLLALIVAYITCLHGVRTLERPPITTDDEHRQQFIRYQLNDHPQIVLVGSSLAHGLKAEYFSKEIISNLALQGGSPLTGLTILSNSRRLPQTVIIEINVLGPPLDTSLVEYFKPIAPALEEPRLLMRDFKPFRTLLCWLLNADPSGDTMQKKSLPPGSHLAYYREREKKLLAQPLSEYDATAAIARAVNSLPDDGFKTRVGENARKVVDFADQLEKSGVRVLFLEMPLMPSVRKGWYSDTVAKAINEANAGRSDRWLKLDLDESQLRWTDAYHLDERSNILVIMALERKLPEFSTSRLARQARDWRSTLN